MAAVLLKLLQNAEFSECPVDSVCLSFLINLYKIPQIVAKKSKKEDFLDENRFDFRKQEIISLLGTRKCIFQ